MKIGILTINDNNNYGNRLQNYAVMQVIKKLGYFCNTINNFSGACSSNYKKEIKYLIKKFLPIKKHKFSYERYNNFKKFNKNIKFSSDVIKNYIVPKDLDKKYDFFITGSDQVWNPNFTRLSNVDLLSFASPQKRISFSASFGISELPRKYNSSTKNELMKFKAISVREDSGKRIVENLTGRKDVEVLIDPTLMLSSEEWDKISKKPRMLKSKKFVLVYFLGNLLNDRFEQINKLAIENDCEVINILDPDSKYYSCGPSEFLYLVKNAFLICTDSFHSCVFSFIYNRPFVVYERIDKNIVSMNSRIETFVNKFKLSDRVYDSQSIDKFLNYDYSEGYEILYNEKSKAISFLQDNLID